MKFAAAVVLAACVPALAQGRLFGLGANGDLVLIDRATGAGNFVASTGFGVNAAAVDDQGRILAMRVPAEIVAVNPNTGAGAVLATLNTAAIVGFGPRGLAIDASGVPWVALSKSSTTEIDIIATINLATGDYTVVGPTGRADIQGLAFDPAGNLFALGIIGGGALLSVNTATGAATPVGAPGSFGGDTQALEFDDTGACFAARANLASVNTATGAATVIGPTGFGDLRGLAFVPAPSCYPDCNGDGALNLADFGCFQTRFALQHPYADCNGDNALNLADFGCFQTRFALGCP